jgi:hypothetical protein
MKFFSSSGPEGFRVFNGLLIQGFVLLKTLDMGFGAELWRRWENTIFAQRGIEILAGEGRNGNGRHDGPLLRKMAA